MNRESGIEQVIRAASLVMVMLVATAASVRAHSGPPFPIVSDRVAGPYRIAIWTDPDATDDGSAGGQFWVRVDPAASGQQLPESTRAAVSIQPTGRGGAGHRGVAEPVDGDVTNQFVALLMDHEGPFSVRVTIDGPLGSAAVESAVDATYDLRPPPYLFALYVLPFVLVGLLWGRLIIRRRKQM